MMRLGMVHLGLRGWGRRIVSFGLDEVQGIQERGRCIFLILKLDWSTQLSSESARSTDKPSLKIICVCVCVSWEWIYKNGRVLCG